MSQSICCLTYRLFLIFLANDNQQTMAGLASMILCFWVVKHMLAMCDWCTDPREFSPTRNKNTIHFLVDFSSDFSVDPNTHQQLITAQFGLAAMGQSERECVCEPEAGRVREVFIEFPVTYYYLSCLFHSRILSVYISILLIPPTLHREHLIESRGEWLCSGMSKPQVH